MILDNEINNLIHIQKAITAEREARVCVDIIVSAGDHDYFTYILSDHIETIYCEDAFVDRFRLDGPLRSVDGGQENIHRRCRIPCETRTFDSSTIGLVMNPSFHSSLSIWR